MGRTNRESAHVMMGHTGRVESLAYSPTGKILATGGGGGDTSIRLWELAGVTPRSPNPCR